MTEQPYDTSGDTLQERFWSKVDRSGGPDACWPWQGSLRSGYGTFSHNGKRSNAHRTAWETVNGPIPDGLQIDHVCHNAALDRGECKGGVCEHRACCNPAHLEAVTCQVNVSRGAARFNGRAPRKPYTLKSHCPRGHAYDAENTRVEANTGFRRCRICDAAKSKRFRALSDPRSQR